MLVSGLSIRVSKAGQQCWAYSCNTYDYTVHVEVVSRSKSCYDSKSHQTDHNPGRHDDGRAMVTRCYKTMWRVRATVAIECQMVR